MKEARKTKAFAVLHDCPSSPQKMRLVADLVRGMDVQRALDTLKFCPKEAARKVEKLLLSKDCVRLHRDGLTESVKDPIT